MAKGLGAGSERLEQYLQGAGEVGMVTTIIHEHFAGAAPFDASSLAVLYRKIPDGHKGRYQKFAAVMMDYLVENVTARFAHLTRRGAADLVLLAPPGREYDRRNFNAHRAEDIASKFPKLRAKIIGEQDMARFASLMGTMHQYGACVNCGSFPSFHIAQPLKHITPMNTRFDISGAMADAAHFVATADWPPNFAGVIGLCNEGPCRAGCLQCGESMPIPFNLEHTKVWIEDHMCPPCAAQQLFNIRPPKFDRAENRKLRNLPIERR